MFSCRRRCGNVQRQAGRQSNRFRGRHLGRLMGIEAGRHVVMQTQIQACAETGSRFIHAGNKGGMHRGNHVQILPGKALALEAEWRA